MNAAIQSETRDIRIKRLLYQSWYRGCKETDRILGHFAKDHIHNFNDKELDQFEEIMQETDHDIFAWISGKQPLPAHYKNHKVMQMVLSYNVARANIPAISAPRQQSGS